MSGCFMEKIDYGSDLRQQHPSDLFSSIGTSQERMKSWIHIYFYVLPN